MKNISLVLFLFVLTGCNNQESLNIIKKAIQENWWEKRYDYIIEAKNKIINELGMLNVINDLINNDNK